MLVRTNHVRYDTVGNCGMDTLVRNFSTSAFDRRDIDVIQQHTVSMTEEFKEII